MKLSEDIAPIIAVAVVFAVIAIYKEIERKPPSPPAPRTAAELLEDRGASARVGCKLFLEYLETDENKVDLRDFTRASVVRINEDVKVSIPITKVSEYGIKRKSSVSCILKNTGDKWELVGVIR